MSQQLVLELSDEVYAALSRQANAVGLSVAEWIVTSLEQQNTSSPTNSTSVDQETARLRFQSHAGAVRLGYATGIDNERIDADLIKAYNNEY